ncbi:helix-turn-helix domain-containing protein [Succinivibrio dextrinosolvens]|uniref:helix-turn-helix domain-containing protein n=1 Tax=Succinivibrio dextrinosolvens TaxID=83771 RepID=UPI00241D1A2B|nr:helix-turn-helix domain-containing protein [Succinivibrio dextrinosolvens]MBE6422600.1 hypothetical protein [Succinivibrio dextrinosolvens]
MASLSKRKNAITILSNIKSLLIVKNMNYSDLCSQADLSPSYSVFFKDPDKFNPTLEVLSSIASSLNVSLSELIDPHLDAAKYQELPEDMKHYDVILTKFQRFRIDSWLKINEKKIKDYQIKKLEVYEKLSKS